MLPFPPLKVAAAEKTITDREDGTARWFIVKTLRAKELGFIDADEQYLVSELPVAGCACSSRQVKTWQLRVINGRGGVNVAAEFLDDITLCYSG